MDGLEEMECRLFGDFLRNTEPVDGNRSFAQPIEDEDLFGLPPAPSKPDALDDPDEPDELFPEVLEDDVGLSTKPVESEAPSTLEEDDEPQVLETAGGSNNNNKENDKANTSNEQASELDDIFLDDYESDSEANNLAGKGKNAPRSYANPVQLPSPAQIKKNLMKERLLQQARAMGGCKFAKDFSHTNTITLTVDQEKMTSNKTSKFFFNKMFNASAKSNKSPEKSKWSQMKSQLRRDICSQKRKVWESFQQPASMLDEEEEIFEVGEDSPEPAEEDEEAQGTPDAAEKAGNSSEPGEDDEDLPEHDDDAEDLPDPGNEDVDDDENASDAEEDADADDEVLASSPDSSIHNNNSRREITLINSDESSNDSQVSPVRRNILEDDEEDVSMLEETNDSRQAEVDS